jgi:hypothetical protein
MYTGGYLYGERRIHTLSRVYAWCGDYLSICRCTIFDDFYMNDLNCFKIHNDNYVPTLLLYI